ncbi:MAG: hypothetical protein R3F08_03910 [Dokdonella sp.]
MPASIVGKIQTALKAQAGQPRVRPFEEFWLLPHSADPTGKSPPDWCLAWATQRDRRSCRWSCSGPMTGRFPDTPAYPRLAVQQFAAAMAWLVGLLSVVVNRVSVFPLVQVQAVGSLIAMERRLFHTWPQRSCVSRTCMGIPLKTPHAPAIAPRPLASGFPCLAPVTRRAGLRVWRILTAALERRGAALSIGGIASCRERKRIDAGGTDDSHDTHVQYLRAIAAIGVVLSHLAFKSALVGADLFDGARIAPRASMCSSSSPAS